MNTLNTMSSVQHARWKPLAIGYAGDSLKPFHELSQSRVRMLRKRCRSYILCVSLLLSAGQLWGAPPPNDNFAERATLSGFPIAIEADNTAPRYRRRFTALHRKRHARENAKRSARRRVLLADVRDLKHGQAAWTAALAMWR